MKQRMPMRRNPVAKALASRLYAPRVIKSKRLYSRKRLPQP